MLTNVRSFDPKTEELKLILSYKQLDTFRITQTWINDDVLDSLFEQCGYLCYRNDRQSRRGGGTSYVDLYWQPQCFYTLRRT